MIAYGANLDWLFIWSILQMEKHSNLYPPSIKGKRT